MTSLIVHAEDWPYGLRCIECDEPIYVGTLYSTRLVSVAEAVVVTEIVCVPCGLGLREAS